MEYITTIAFGFCVGLASTVAGLGGGVFVIPFLMLNAKLSIPVAVGTSLTIIAVSKITVSLIHIKQKLIAPKILLHLALASIPGVFCGFYLNKIIPELYFKLMFALILVLIAYKMLTPHTTAHIKTSNITILATGFIAGAFSSGFGVGSGFICVPVIHKLCGENIKISIGTSNCLILFFTLIGSLKYIYASSVNFKYAIFLGLAMIFSSMIAAAFINNIRDKLIRISFSGLLSFTAIVILANEFLLS